jgi:protein ImuB
MLWIGIHLPLLSLEAFRAALLPTHDGAADTGPEAVALPRPGDAGCVPSAGLPPVALLEGAGSGGARIAQADAAAQALGVRPGLKRATALALAPALVLGLADARRDRQAIGALAQAALAFSPRVTLEPWTGALGELGLEAAAGGPARGAGSGGGGGAGSGAAAGGRSAARAPPRADDGLVPHTVLLEVRSTLGLFGGRSAAPHEQLRGLLARLHAVLAPLGHAMQCAVAPTAGGAALLARRAPRWGDDALATALFLPTPAALERALDAAPVWLLGPGREHWEALQGMGLRTVADLRRLPRSGVARRFGEALLDELDRALGAAPDPRAAVALPGRFASRLELFARADTAEQVLHGAQLLLARLVGWLGAQHARARRVALHLHHERWRSVPRDGRERPAVTTLEVALAEPSADAAHLALLLRERLGRLPLPAPALELALTCDDLAHQPAPNGELFPSAASQREGWVRLIERLQARLGPAGVVQLEVVDDHRPERTSAARPAAAALPAARRGARAERGMAPPRALPTRGAARAAGAASVAAAAGDGAGPAIGPPTGRACAAPQGDPPGGARPVYLLARPQPLREGPHGPLLGRDTLRLVSGPERLETGWWDGPADGNGATPGFVERDYFIAQAPDGALVWIYHLRRPPLPAEDAGSTGPATDTGWFLQGRFA